MGERVPIPDLIKSIVPNLVSCRVWGDAAFINMPIVYPSGAFVTVRITHVSGGVRISDSGFAYREADSFGAGRSFSKTAQAVSEDYDIEVGKRSIYVDVQEHEVERAIFDVSAASHEVAARIVSRAAVTDADLKRDGHVSPSNKPRLP